MAEPPVEAVVKEIVQEIVDHCHGSVTDAAETFWTDRYTRTVSAARKKYGGQLDWERDRADVLKRARKVGREARVWANVRAVDIGHAYLASWRVEKKCQEDQGHYHMLWRYCEGPMLGDPDLSRVKVVKSKKKALQTSTPVRRR